MHWKSVQEEHIFKAKKLYALHVHHTVKYILTNTKHTRTSIVTHLSFSLISSQPVMCLMCSKEDREQGKVQCKWQKNSLPNHPIIIH